jgi:outer membrane murein-binding lipoprotein Lpp
MAKQNLLGFHYSEIRLQEDVPSKGIETLQLLRIGSFRHPSAPGGVLNITQDMLRNMKLNFDNNVRRLTTMALAVDYGHNSDDKAAGWIKAIELRNEDKELWINVDWTPQASRAIEEKEWRLLSADLELDYVDNETGKKYGPTLLGAGLTNRPHIKDMQAILSEHKNKKEEFKMDEQLKELLAKIGQLEAKVAALESQLGAKKEEVATKEKEMGEQAKKLEESEQKLSEATVKIAKIEEEKAVALKEAKFAELMGAGKVVPAQKETFMKMDIALAEELFGKGPALNLSEKGNGKAPAPKLNETKEEKSAQDEINEKAEALVASEKITFGEAVRKVMRENVELAEKYHVETTQISLSEEEETETEE